MTKVHTTLVSEIGVIFHPLEPILNSVSVRLECRAVNHVTRDVSLSVTLTVSAAAVILSREPTILSNRFKLN